ncbi:hypothetical protein A9P82_12510 [Arachidicoccus ginsenosidimutans]|uniref:hypothetical protein n=1 Tax=Arachidicoccus sp. BS20 TaxID=1850526 RepID=UPI0007F11C30|nr:hypothetical protein [Arachidicoccus sp. BS20]ANI90031.1 hypothetical protein A9P82_12510 [Arachidicoccus sp. BS20]
MEENQTSGTAGAGHNQSEEVKEFLKQGFLPLVRKIIFRPTELQSEFSENDNSVKSIVMIIICGVLYAILPYIFVGRVRQYLGFKYFLQLGLLTIIILLLISIFTWLLKLAKGKSMSFKVELLSGGLCAIPLIVLLVVSCILSLFGTDIFSAGISALYNGSWLFSLIGLYCLLLMINIFYQSLCSGGYKPNAAWYLAPVGILLAFYIAFKIAYSLF